MKTYKIVAIIALMCCIACNNEEDSTVELPNDASVPESADVNLKLLDYTPNVYHKYFSAADQTVGMSAVKSNPLEDHVSFQNNTFNEGSDQYVLELNNKTLSLASKDNKYSQMDINTIFGKEITIKIKPKGGKSFKNGDSAETVNLYIPEKIEITNPKVANVEEQLPYCYYEDFVLEWNKDPKNTEGLVVVAEYYGATILKDKSNKPAVINTDIIDVDNGRAVLNNALWEGIPNSAIVYISILRGNVVLEKVNGEVVKFYAETHAELPIILIKDENTIQ